MESATKHRQATATLARMVEQAFGPHTVPPSDDWVHEFHNGWFSVAYDMSLADGRQVVCKIGPRPGVRVLTYERDLMPAEVAVTRMLGERTSLPVPEVLHADFTGGLIEAPWFMMTRLPGVPLNEAQPQLDEATFLAMQRQIGAWNRELNGIRGQRFGDFLNPAETTWRPAFLRMMDDILRDGERVDADLGVPYADVRRCVEVFAPALDEVRQPVYVAWDMWDGNILADGDRLTGVIDCERGFWGDPLFESGFLGLFADAPDRARAAFREGYGLTSFTPDEMRRRWLYDLYLATIMVVETIYREHTDDTARREAQAFVRRTMGAFEKLKTM